MLLFQLCFADTNKIINHNLEQLPFKSLTHLVTISHYHFITCRIYIYVSIVCVLCILGPKLNSFVCPQPQLDGVGTYLIFEMPNDHIGSCVAMVEVTPKSHHFILTVSKKAVLINMEGIVVAPVVLI